MKDEAAKMENDEEEEPDVMARACNPSTWEVETEGAEVPGLPLLNETFERDTRSKRETGLVWERVSSVLSRAQ